MVEVHPFDAKVIDMIHDHMVIGDFKNKSHARHRLANKVYKYERKVYTDLHYPEAVAKDSASEMAKRACKEWQRLLDE